MGGWEGDTAMNVVPLEKTTLTLSAIAEMAKKGPVILTNKGRPLVSVNSLKGCDWESISLANNPKFMAIIEESRRSYREEGGITLEDLCQELGLEPPKRNGKRAKRKK
jgi:hypothetical protein